MPKHDFLTPKAISNRQKSVGLQKLRWYCQMCQKQCRDENGFKCHTSSEGHLRQMRLFAENPHSIIDSFSKEFEQGYLQTLSHRHGTKRVKANVVYQEYIADKNHVHMNATCWTTLTGFCMHLGREGKAVVDETEKGWFIQYIDRDPKMLARKQQAEQRQKYEMDEEERHKREIEAQIKAAEALLEKANEESEQVDNSLLRSEDQEKIAVSLHLDNGGSVLKKRALQGVFSADEDEDVDVLPEEKKRMVSSGIGGARHFLPAGPSFSTSSSTSKNMRVLDHLMLEEQKRKKSKEGASKGEKADESDSKKKKDFWLWKGIFVKVVNEQLFGGKLHKQKGRVLQVLDRYSAEVEIDGKTYKIDQGDLETVIPAIGQAVLVLRGPYEGNRAELVRLHIDDYNCDVCITEKGSSNGTIVNAVDYEDISKI